MQIITFFIFLAVTSLQYTSGNTDLYIIADKQNSPYVNYPSTSKTFYKNDSITLAVCFKHKSIVPDLNPFCFDVDLQNSSHLNEIVEVKGTIWNYIDLENYIDQNYDLYSKDCGKLFEDFENVYILLKEDIIYKKFKVIKCYSFVD